MLNAILFLCCVVLFIMAGISLCCGAWPLAFILMIIFSLCYKAMRYEGPQPKHVVIHIADDCGDEDEGEPEPDYQAPFNRENFEFN